MSRAAGFVLAAGAIALANDAIFAPVEAGKTPLSDLGANWRIIPATGILAVLLTGVESVSPKFGAGLGMLVLLSVLVIPFGNAGTPLESLANLVSQKKA